VNNQNAHAPLAGAACSVCFVYIVAAGRRFKVGHSGNLKRRVGAIQTGNPDSVVVRKIWTTPSRKIAKECEDVLHSSLSRWRTRPDGEWYCAPRSVVCQLAAWDDLLELVDLLEVKNALTNHRQLTSPNAERSATGQETKS
jgi:hypothetical protein